MRSITRTGNQKGFSLLELLISVTLLAIGLMAAASMQTTAINANHIAVKHTELASFAQQVMEDLLSLSSKDLKLKNGGTADYDLDPKTAGNSIEHTSSGVFTARYTITPNTPVTAVTKIDVTATQQGTFTRTFRLTAYKRVE